MEQVFLFKFEPMEFQFTTQLVKADEALWDYRALVPNQVSNKLVNKNSKRVMCSVLSDDFFHCSLFSDGDDYFISINKELRKKHNLQEGNNFEVTLKKDESKYGSPMPVEFDEILKQDSEMDKLFHDLTPGLQRNLLYIINQAKRSETRLKKANVITQYLKSTNGKLDFKELNMAFKMANKK